MHSVTNLLIPFYQDICLFHLEIRLNKWFKYYVWYSNTALVHKKFISIILYCTTDLYSVEISYWSGRKRASPPALHCCSFLKNTRPATFIVSSNFIAYLYYIYQFVMVEACLGWLPIETAWRTQNTRLCPQSRSWALPAGSRSRQFESSEATHQHCMCMRLARGRNSVSLKWSRRTPEKRFFAAALPLSGSGLYARFY